MKSYIKKCGDRLLKWGVFGGIPVSAVLFYCGLISTQPILLRIAAPYFLWVLLVAVIVVVVIPALHIRFCNKYAERWGVTPDDISYLCEQGLKRCLGYKHWDKEYFESEYASELLEKPAVTEAGPAPELADIPQWKEKGEE